MKAVLLLVCLVVVQGALAGDSSDEGDRKFVKGKGVTAVQKKKEESSKKQSKSAKSSVTTKVVQRNEKPLKVKTQVAEVPHRIRQVHYGNDHHLDVFRLSNGLQAVALDDSFGRVVDYLYLGTNIQLIPEDGSYFLQATDLLDGHQTFVDLATVNGHLSLSEVRIGNGMYQGFQGFDIDGPVFVPVEKSIRGLVVRPVVYRVG